MYAHDILENLKRSCATWSQEAGELNHLVPVEPSPFVFPTRGGRLAGRPEDISLRCIQNLIYPEGDSTKPPGIKVARIYLALHSAPNSFIISEHIEGESLEFALSSYSVRQLFKFMTIFLWLPPLNNTSTLGAVRRDNEQENAWRQAEKVLCQMLARFDYLTEMAERFRKSSPRYEHITCLRLST